MTFTYGDASGGFNAEFSYTERNVGSDGGQKGGQKGGQIRDNILSIIDSNPNVTRAELVIATGISPSAVQKHIEALKKSGLIRRIGGDRGGHWEVIK